MKITKLFSLVLVFSAALVGCVSPLKSSDPTVRLQAVNQIEDNEALLLVALDVEMEISDRNATWRTAQYPNDVKERAVERISNVQDLMRIATYVDGDRFAAGGFLRQEQGRGNEYYEESYSYFYFKVDGQSINGDIARNFAKVNTGDVVRNIAKNRLAEKDSMLAMARIANDEILFKQTIPIVSVYENYGFKAKRKDFSNFPNDGWKSGNPFDKLIGAGVDKLDTQGLIEYIEVAAIGGPIRTPEAFGNALEKLAKAKLSSSEAEKIYRMVYMKNRGGNRRGHLASKFFAMIDQPAADILVEAFNRCDNASRDKMLDLLSGTDRMFGIYKGKALLGKTDTDKKLFIQYSHKQVCDLIPEEASLLVDKVKDQATLARLAGEAELYNIRYEALKRLEPDNATAIKIAEGEIKDFDIADEKKNSSTAKMDLRKIAIESICNVDVLKRIRKNEKNEAIKAEVTKRLSAVGASDDKEIIECIELTQDVLVMLNGVVENETLQRIAQEAKLKCIRLLAASRLSDEDRIIVAQKEYAAISGSASEGHFSIDGMYLGMSIEDLLAILEVKYHSVETEVCLADDLIAIRAKDGRDIAWAKKESGSVFWITLPPEVVKKMVGFKQGSFNDLETAVERKFRVNLAYDRVEKGAVSQQIGTIDTIEGETFRYFKGDLEKGEAFDRQVRKMSNNLQSGGFGGGFADMFENAMQADENARDSKNNRFAKQGSIQLQYTKDAPKTEYGHSGTFK